MRESSISMGQSKCDNYEIRKSDGWIEHSDNSEGTTVVPTSMRMKKPSETYPTPARYMDCLCAGPYDGSMAARCDTIFCKLNPADMNKALTRQSATPHIPSS